MEGESREDRVNRPRKESLERKRRRVVFKFKQSLLRSTHVSPINNRGPDSVSSHSTSLNHNSTSSTDAIQTDSDDSLGSLQSDEEQIPYDRHSVREELVSGSQTFNVSHVGLSSLLHNLKKYLV